MDVFDEYLYTELINDYAQPNLQEEDYEELYQRFLNINHVPEVNPFILTMRYFGLGVHPEPDVVMNELKESNAEDIILVGLYNDLLLFENPCNEDAKKNLIDISAKGYSEIFLKDRSYLHVINTENDKVPTIEKQVDNSINPDEFTYQKMTFESNGYSGLYFASREIDYLNAIVYFNEIKSPIPLKVRSQIFQNDEPFSEIFSNEYTLQEGWCWIRTTGWGNTSFNCYNKGTYQWRVEINGADVYSQNFTIYRGSIDKIGPTITDLKLFASQWTQALKTDQENYKTAFSKAETECIYFKFFIQNPKHNSCVQVHKKIVRLDDDYELCDCSSLVELQDDTTALWSGWGYSESGKWKKGLYEYHVSLGSADELSGTFTIY